MKLNPLNLIDFYKADHRRQYPENTTLVFSNFTPRKSRIPGVDYVVFFGLQYYIKQYLTNVWNENFFKQPKDLVLKHFNRRKDAALGPNNIGDKHIAALHDLGYLPLQIMALPEGAKVPIRVAPMVMWNTHPDFFWLVNYLETSMSASLWQMCTSATLSHQFREVFDHFAEKTGGPKEFVQWQGHDFSFRGMSSIESAAMSGAGHLLSFTGTDTVHAIDFLEQYYEADCEKELIGGSVPATEHSVMCMGMEDGEFETFERLITEVYPSGIVSIVSDTWDLWTVMTDYLPRLKDKIMARNGKVVIRPDSGDPVDIICGTLKYESKEQYELMKIASSGAKSHTVNGNPKTAEQKGVVELLWDSFGGKINEKGYKELDPHVGCIYGDSINIQRAKDICSRLEAKGFASTNWVAGIGSYTYQYNTRDTQGWAMKATYGELAIKKMSGISTEPREIFKDPKTDDGTKKSAKGLVAVYPKGESYEMEDQVEWDDVLNCAYNTVFLNGRLMREYKLDEVRDYLNK